MMTFNVVEGIVKRSYNWPGEKEKEELMLIWIYVEWKNSNEIEIRSGGENSFSMLFWCRI